MKRENNNSVVAYRKYRRKSLTGRQKGTKTMRSHSLVQEFLLETADNGPQTDIGSADTNTQTEVRSTRGNGGVEVVGYSDGNSDGSDYKEDRFLGENWHEEDLMDESLKTRKTLNIGIAYYYTQGFGSPDKTK